MLKFIITSTLSLLIVSCGHHNDVRPGANGIHRVVVQSATKQDGSRDAIEQSNHFCKQYERRAAFVDERQHYTGSVNENTYNGIRKISQAAIIFGSGASFFGGETESRIGGVAALGGFAGQGAFNDGYKAEMSFKCI